MASTGEGSTGERRDFPSPLRGAAGGGRALQAPERETHPPPQSSPARGEEAEDATGDGAGSRSRGGKGPVISLLFIGLIWGLNWPAVKLAVTEIGPWTLRATGLSIAGVLLLAMAPVMGRSLRVPRMHWGRLVTSGMLNVAGFNISTGIAQTLMPTSRATIVTFTMPLWATILAKVFLGERIGWRRLLALGLGLGGLGIVLAPLVPGMVESGVPLGIVFVLIAAVSWAAGTVVSKALPISADPLSATGWQVLIGALAAAAGMVLLEGFQFGPMTLWGWGGFVYNIVLGLAVPYILWFGVVARVPASTATIGTLLIPVVGVTSSMLVLGDRPSVFDLGGFVLILAAVAITVTAGRGR